MKEDEMRAKCKLKITLKNKPDSKQILALYEQIIMNTEMLIGNHFKNV